MLAMDAAHNELTDEHGSMTAAELQRLLDSMAQDGLPTEAEES